MGHSCFLVALAACCCLRISFVHAAIPESIEHSSAMQITAKNWEATLGGDRPVLLEAYGVGCGQCWSFFEHYERVAQHFNKQDAADPAEMDDASWSAEAADKAADVLVARVSQSDPVMDTLVNKGFISRGTPALYLFRKGSASHPYKLELARWKSAPVIAWATRMVTNPDSAQTEVEQAHAMNMDNRFNDQGLDDDEKMRLKNAFDTVDANTDGVLQKPEYKVFISKYRMVSLPADQHAKFKRFAGSDNLLSSAELLTVQRNDPNTMEYLQKLDADKDGQLSFDEWSGLFKLESDTTHAATDKNGDGFIVLDEWFGERWGDDFDWEPYGNNQAEWDAAKVKYRKEEQAFIDGFDADGDGRMSRIEHQLLHRPVRESNIVQVAATSFFTLDVDESGTLTMSELKAGYESGQLNANEL